MDADLQNGKHFRLTITDDSFSFSRNEKTMTTEARLDGIYVVRTNVPAEHSRLQR